MAGLGKLGSQAAKLINKFKKTKFKKGTNLYHGTSADIKSPKDLDPYAERKIYNVDTESGLNKERGVTYFTDEPKFADEFLPTKEFRDYEEGSKIEDFEMLNKKGKTVRISDFQDKIVYLNFWGTWCKPCIANIPDLNKFIESYQENEDVIFLNVAIRSNEEKWKESIKKFDLKGVNLFIPEGENHDRIRSKFGASGLPHYAIIGKENILKVNYANKAPKVKTELDSLLKANN